MSREFIIKDDKIFLRSDNPLIIDEEYAWFTDGAPGLGCIGISPMEESGYSYFTKEEIDQFIECLKVLRNKI